LKEMRVLKLISNDQSLDYNSLTLNRWQIHIEVIRIE
jgi:hypothetical protein